MHKPTQTIEIYQLENGKRIKFGVKSQMENILRNFLKDYWPSSTSVDTHATKLDQSAVTEAKKNADKDNKGSVDSSCLRGLNLTRVLLQGGKLKKSGFFSWVFGGDKAEKPKPEPAPAKTSQKTPPKKQAVAIDIEKVKKLADMGFSEDASFKGM